MSPTTLGTLYLLPSELLQSILLRLPLPDILRLRSLSRHLLLTTSSLDHFLIPSSPWLFLLLSLPPRRSLLRAFDPRSNRWFTLPFIPPSSPSPHPLYLLAASPRLLLLASNSLRRLLVLDLTTKTFLTLPDSPLGPRDTSSWRRSSLKLVSEKNTNNFLFYFADLDQHSSNRPVLKLFRYRSDTNSWSSINIQQNNNDNQVLPRGGKDNLYLHVVQSRSDSFVIRADEPVPVPYYRRIYRNAGHVEGSHTLHVYGDGKMAIVSSTDSGPHMKVVKGVEVWGLGEGWREWELVSRVDEGVIEGIRRPYGVMVGCLEEREGVIRLVLVANCKGSWDLTWLNFDWASRAWERVPVPDCESQGLNMAGIAVSSNFFGFLK